MPFTTQLNGPSGLVIDSSGKLYVCDTANNRIRKVDLTALSVTTLAGSSGLPGDGGLAANALLFAPAGVALDAAGSLYIADNENHRVRKVSPQGLISTVAGNGSIGFSGDGGDARNAQLSYPQGVAIDGAGNLLIADTENSRVRRVNAGGIIQTIAGNGTFGFSGDGGPAMQAAFNGATAVATDMSGNLFIVDAGNNRIRKINSAGVITTLAGSDNPTFLGDGGPANVAGLDLPEGVAVDDKGNVFIADTRHNRVRKVSPTGIITTVAGTGVHDFRGDGNAAISAQLAFPGNVAIDKIGNLFIHDTLNGRIRVVLPSGVITTIAGDGGYSAQGDGGPALSASLGDLTGLALAPDARVYFADSQNHVVRSLRPIPITPVVSAAGIANAASFTAGAVSPGEIITIYGTDLGSATPQGAVVDGAKGVATTVGGTTVIFNGRPAPLLYVSASQISAIVPYGLFGSARMQVMYNNVFSNPVIVPVVEAAPALFTANASGSGPAAALNQDGSVNSPQNPAARGSVVVLFGTGEGETNPSGVDGQLATGVYPKPVLPVSVAIGGQVAQILYAGAAPGQVAGVFQINALVPDGAGLGPVFVYVTVGSKSSPSAAVTVSIR